MVSFVSVFAYVNTVCVICAKFSAISVPVSRVIAASVHLYSEF